MKTKKEEKINKNLSPSKEIMEAVPHENNLWSGVVSREGIAIGHGHDG